MNSQTKAAQACDTDNPCIHTDYPNDFEKIYDFYQGLTEAEYDWLTAPAQDELRELINEFLLSHPAPSPLSSQKILFLGLSLKDDLLELNDFEWIYMNGFVNQTSRVNIKKADHSTLNEPERGQHIYKWLRYIAKLQNCGFTDSNQLFQCQRMKAFSSSQSPDAVHPAPADKE